MNLNHLRNNNNDPSKVTNNVILYFDNLEENLINHIKDAEYVIGCVSWLTNLKIIKALQRKKGVKIVIQKENFIKRDYSYSVCLNEYYINLRKGYKAVPNLFNNIENIKIDKNSSIHQLCENKLSDDDFFDGIRCFGFAKASHKPLMHHKFLIFMDKNLQPYGVWTGSYNFTNNANNSLDNGLFISDSKIIEGYSEEFEQILFLSEKINWESAVPKNN
jgi:hypothetical protein